MADIEDIIEKMARLARLDIPPGQMAKFVAKARAVISYVEQLGELSTDGIEPTSHAVSMKDGVGTAAGSREDLARPCPLADEILAQAPSRDGRLIQVPKVIDDEG